MEPYKAAFAGVHASADFKRRMIGMMLAQNEPHADRVSRQVNSCGMSAKRRALIIAIAAVLLLLSACAAYAVYWSSVQLAKQDAAAKIEIPEDTLQREAEAYADADVRATTLTAQLSGGATVGDVTVQLVAVDVDQYEDGAEYLFYFSLQSDSVGFITSFEPEWLKDDQAARDRLTQYDTFCEIGIDARDFVLTIDGQAFQPYAKPDYNGIKQPTTGWNAATEDTSWTSSFLLRQNPVPITQDSQMVFSGTLYACDAAGVRTGTIGSFSIDFAYRYPAEQAEAIRQNAITRYREFHQATNETRLDLLGQLPEAAVPIGLTQDDTTLTDVAVLEDGLLIGTTRNLLWPEPESTRRTWLRFYLDGYMMSPETMDQSWDLDTSQQPNEAGEYPSRSTTSLLRIPFYRHAQDMPEDILVYVTQRHEYYSDTTKSVVVDSSIRPLDLIFYVNRVTGAVTLPRDDAEKESWITKQKSLASDGRNDSRDYIIHQAQTIGDMTVVLERMQFFPESKTILLHAFIPVIDCEVMPWEMDPAVSIDGVALQPPPRDTYDRMLDPSTPAPFQTDIDEWIDTYGLNANRFCWYDFTLAAPESFFDMPETFRLNFTWDVYDLDQNGERTFKGTFVFETTVLKNDSIAFQPEDQVYEMQWRRSVMGEYGIEN
ncbi:MAG: hypothetical protein GX417_04180 [Clostridiales bacterium]|nr:hypothetical protein [Clostridiales bacterium]